MFYAYANIFQRPCKLQCKRYLSKTITDSSDVAKPWTVRATARPLTEKTCVLMFKSTVKSMDERLQTATILMGRYLAVLLSRGKRELKKKNWAVSGFPNEQCSQTCCSAFEKEIFPFHSLWWQTGKPFLTLIYPWPSKPDMASNMSMQTHVTGSRTVPLFSTTLVI